MKKFLLLIAIINCMAIGSRAQTVQCQTTSGAWGPCPLNASVQLFTTQAATATATATAQKVYNFNMTGTFLVTYAGITGSPATCTLQVKTGDSLGNVSNNNTALSLTPATGSTTIAFAPTSTQQQGDQMTVVYACGTYPTAGTVSVEFVPSTSAPLPPATLFSGTAATATATSFAVRTPGQSGYGDLEITGSGITGSPSGCTIALAYQSNTGSPTGSTQATVSFTPGNSLQVLPVVPTNPTGDQYVATYACSTYPTAGTISVAFAPTTPVVIAGTLPAAIISGQQAVTASAVALASNALTKGICIEALSTNSISVFVGPSGVTTSTGIELPAKSSYCTSVANSNALYVIASTTGASVTWSGN